MNKLFSKSIAFSIKYSLLILLASLSASAQNASNQCVNREPKGIAPKSNLQFFLEGGTRFKVKLDVPVSSANYRAGDVIQFKTVENVFGLVTDEKGNATVGIGERIIVIPKDTMGFGKIDFAKRRFPLFINGKARVTATLDYLILESGDCIPVTLAYYLDERIDPTNANHFPQYVENCRNIKDALCIRGRRPNTAFTP